MNATSLDDLDVMHADPLTRVAIALEDLRQGRMVIMVDDEDRENEGDIVIGADRITPEAVNFMASHARGLICLSMTGAQIDRLGLPMMATQNQSAYNTAFTASIEAREGVTTGISAADRAHTIGVAIKPDASRKDIVTPGHVFPLRARDGGVLERVGQTEGSVDLARLAGLAPAAVICEIMNADGSMARLPELKQFARTHGLHIVAVADLIKHRMQHERIVHRVQEGEVEVPGLGRWHIRLYRGLTNEGLHVSVHLGALDRGPTLVRVQASAPTWSFLDPAASVLAGSARAAMERIHGEGRGAVVLMHAGGRSTDLLERLFVRDFAGDASRVAQPTADALRDLGAGCQILRDLGLEQLRLLSTNARPISGIEAYGLRITETLPLAGGVAAR